MTTFDRRMFLGASCGSAAALALGAHRAVAADSADTSQLGRTPHTKFAVNIEMWWKNLPFLDRLKQAAAFGYPGVEFWALKNKDIDAIADLAEQLKIDIVQFTAWGFSPGLNDPINHSAFVEAVEQGCEVAKKFNCPMMTVVAGNDIPGMSQEQMHDNVIAGLKLGAPIAERNKVTLILEPMNIRVDHKGHCLYGSPPAIRICREVGSPNVKINWDLYHMEISEGDLCGRLKEGFPYVGYLQLADNPGRNEPGTGEINYTRVLREAYDLGYRGYVGLECRPKTTELAAAQAVAKVDVW